MKCSSQRILPINVYLIIYKGHCVFFSVRFFSSKFQILKVIDDLL